MVIAYKPVRIHTTADAGVTTAAMQALVYSADSAVGERTRIAKDAVGAAFRRQMALAAISCQSIRQVAGHTGQCGALEWTLDSSYGDSRP